MVLVVIGFITQNPVWYGYAAAAWGIGLSPLIPLWLFNVFITIWIYNLLKKKSR
jgi:CHASE2 domain-containing sensor protein